MRYIAKDSEHMLCRAERIISVVAGAYLLYNALNNKKSMTKAFAAGVMLYRGLTGSCPVYDSGRKALNEAGL